MELGAVMSVIDGTNVEVSNGTIVDVVIISATDTSSVTDGRVEGTMDATSTLTNGGISVVTVVTGKYTKAYSASASSKASLKSIIVDSMVDEGISSRLEKLVSVKNC